jgi:hypothetical protein
MLWVEPRCSLQSFLGKIEHVFVVGLVFRHVVYERAERDCEQLFTQAEKSSKRYDGIRDPAGMVVNDYVLDISEIVAFGVDHVRAADIRRVYGKIENLCT